MTTRVPPPLVWHISQINVNILFLVVFTCVLNQSRGYSLLNDALNFTMSICLKLREEYGISCSFDNYMEKELVVTLELGFLASNIKYKFCDVLSIFIFIF